MRWRLFLRQKNQASNTVFRNNEKSLLAKTSLFFFILQLDQFLVNYDKMAMRHFLIIFKHCEARNVAKLVTTHFWTY